MSTRKPFIIGIGGAHSSVGKTSLAAAIIRFITSHQSVSPFGKQPRLGAIKYTRTPLYASLVEDESLIGLERKDTARLSGAGAEKVLWIQSPRTELEEIVTVALSRLADLDVIVIEGNSAIEFAKPDIVIFIIGETEKSIKPSALKLSSQADIIIVPDAAWTVRLVSMTSAKIHAVKDYPYVFDDETILVIISLMDEIVKKKEIERMLKERAIDARITCTAARMIAEELSVSYSEIGNAANELKIKIKNCELGCF
jgi:molybdopterin-guanine dinucleotide biosynthesis protein